MLFGSKKRLKNLNRPMVILVKFDQPDSERNRQETLWHFFGKDNVVEPERLDEVTYKVLWINLNWFDKPDGKAITRISDSCGKVKYITTYPE